LRTTTERRAAVYVRISLDLTGEGLGVARQEEDARAIIERRGWTLVGVYSDNSISASNAKTFRPGYAKLQQDYRDGLFDALVVWDLDRLTRQPRQLEDWIDAAETGQLAVVTTNGEADLTTDAGRLFARIKLAVARSEVERKSARRKRALQQHAEAGRIPHAPRLFGYAVDGGVDSVEAPVVQKMYRMFSAGESLRSLAKFLDDQGVPTRSGRPWHPASVRDMLSNPRYAGWSVYRGQITVKDAQRVKGQWDALVSEEEFEVVTAMLSDPARKTNKVGTHRRYMGSALFVCDECGKPVTTVNGGKYTCPGHFIRQASHVDRLVLDVITERLGRPDLSELLAASEDGENAELFEESRRLRDRLARIDADYDDGIIDARRWREAKQKVGARLGGIDRKLGARKGSAALGAVTGSPDPAQRFAGASLMSQRSVIGALVEVRLRRVPKGRPYTGPDGQPVVDPSTVVIDWKR